MVTEDYVSSETAKLLKEKGFREWCSYCYGLDVRYKGKSIDQDEEFELKEQGCENELEYVDGGRFYDFGCDNRKEGSPYAAPSLYVAMKWLMEEHNLFIGIHPRLSITDYYWITADIYRVKKKSSFYHMGDVDDYNCVACCDGTSFEGACESAIKYCLEKLI